MQGKTISFISSLVIIQCLKCQHLFFSVCSCSSRWRHRRRPRTVLLFDITVVTWSVLNPSVIDRFARRSLDDQSLRSLSIAFIRLGNWPDRLRSSNSLLGVSRRLTSSAPHTTFWLVVVLLLLLLFTLFCFVAKWFVSIDGLIGGLKHSSRRHQWCAVFQILCFLLFSFFFCGRDHSLLCSIILLYGYELIYFTNHHRTSSGSDYNELSHCYSQYCCIYNEWTLCFALWLSIFFATELQATLQFCRRSSSAASFSKISCMLHAIYTCFCLLIYACKINL